IRDGTLLKRPTTMLWVELTTFLLTAAVPIWLFAHTRPAFVGAIVLGLIAALILGEFAIFQIASLLFDGIYPAAATLAVFGAMLLSSLSLTRGAFQRFRGGPHQSETNEELARQPP